MTIAGISFSDLVATLSEAVENCDDHIISFIYLGGSIVKQQSHGSSDLDIFASVPHFDEMNAEERVKVQMDFLSLFEDRIAERIDLTIFEKLRVDIQLDVFREGVLLFERSREERIQFMERTMRFGFDFKIWLDIYLKQAME